MPRARLTLPVEGESTSVPAQQTLLASRLAFRLRIFDRNQGEKARTKYEAQSSRFCRDGCAQPGGLRCRPGPGLAMKMPSLLARRYNGHYLQEAHEVRDNLEYQLSPRRHHVARLPQRISQDYRQVNLDALNANMQVWLSLHQVSFAAATEIVP